MYRAFLARFVVSSLIVIIAMPGLRIYLEVIYLSFFTLKLSNWFLFALKLSVRLLFFFLKRVLNFKANFFFLKFFTLKLSTLLHGNELRNN